MRTTAVLVLVGTLALAACSSLDGNGDIVTEDRTVADFDGVHADNGVRVTLTVDSAATGDPSLSVTTDSNLQEHLVTSVAGSTLTVSSNRRGGITPSGAFDVSGTVDVITDVSVDNGARVKVTGEIGDVRLSADNGAEFNGDNLQATSVEVDADNGAQMTVCSAGTVSGEVRNGAQLTVLCGGSIAGVETSDGATVSSAP